MARHQGQRADPESSQTVKTDELKRVVRVTANFSTVDAGRWA